jgi:hypothetical protein
VQPWDAAYSGFAQGSAARLRYSPALQQCAFSSGHVQPLQSAALSSPAAAAGDAPNPAAWLITGGGGALGLLTAAWLAAGSSSSSTASAASAATTAAADPEAARGSAVELDADGGKGCGSWKRLVLTSRSGRLAFGQQPQLVRQLLVGDGAFATCCVTITRYILPSSNVFIETSACFAASALLMRLHGCHALLHYRPHLHVSFSKARLHYSAGATWPAGKRRRPPRAWRRAQRHPWAWCTRRARWPTRRWGRRRRRWCVGCLRPRLPESLRCPRYVFSRTDTDLALVPCHGCVRQSLHTLESNHDWRISLSNGGVGRMGDCRTWPGSHVCVKAGQFTMHVGRGHAAGESFTLRRQWRTVWAQCGAMPITSSCLIWYNHCAGSSTELSKELAMRRVVPVPVMCVSALA